MKNIHLKYWNSKQLHPPKKQGKDYQQIVLFYKRGKTAVLTWSKIKV